MLLLGATAALVVLLARSPGIVGGDETAPALFIALPLVALFGAHRARRIRSHCLHMSVFMAAAAVAAFKFVDAGESAVAGMLWIMVLGMAAGMWAGW